MKWLLKGGRLFQPSQRLDKICDVLIEDRHISAVGKNLAAGDAPSVDVSGKIVLPGFLDMHVHLREPGREDKETIETGCRAAVRGGFTAVACMPNTTPVIDNAATVQFVLTRAAKSLCRVYPIGAVSKGEEGKELAEMGRMKDAGAVAFSDDGKPVKTAELMRRALEYTKMLKVPVIDHCEEETLARGVMHEGYISTILGLNGIPAASEIIAVGRNLALAELTGGRLHLAHLSCARSVELVREAKSRGVHVTAEVTIHHLLFTDEKLTTYDTNYRINPPLRTEADRKALIEGLKDGTIDALVSDHAPHTREEKEVEFDSAPSGISGVEVLVPLALSELVNKKAITLERLTQSLAERPYEILGLKPPQLSEGEEAHFTVIDLEAKETVDVGGFESKGKNSPYHGTKVTGLPILTVVAGNVCMEQRKVIDRWNPKFPAFTPSPS